MFLVSKFTEGAWVVVIAVPAFILLFTRIHAYYVKAAVELRIDQTPPKPVAKRTIVIVPVNRLSRLTGHALTEALSMGQEVKAVTVVLQGGDEGDRYINTLREEWRKWDPGVALHVVHNEYASVVRAHRGVHRRRAPETTPTIRSSCSSPSCARTTCASASCTTRSTWCSPGPCAAAATSWWPG